MNEILATSMSTQQSTNIEDSTTLSDEESDELSSEDADEEEYTEDFLDHDDPFGWTIINEEMVDNMQELPAEELLGEDFEREAADNGISLFKFSSLINSK